MMMSRVLSRASLYSRRRRRRRIVSQAAREERSDGVKEKKFKKCPDLRCDDFQTKNIPDHDPVSRVLRRFRFAGRVLNLADVCM